AGPTPLTPQEPYPPFRPAQERVAAAADQLVFGRGRQLPVQAGSGRPQLARLDPHQFPQCAPSLHARYAAQEPVLGGPPLPLVGLRASAERARAGELAVVYDARMVARRDRPG